MDGDFGHHLLIAVMEFFPRDEFAIDRYLMLKKSTLARHFVMIRVTNK